ncbi:MAG: hypothetical protein HKN03_13520 [Acidimicrobiales bacterium]|nr:hypothetical protein [Acidimicrobiales bacterium]
MVIEKGGTYGTPGPNPAHLPQCGNDRELAAHIAEAGTSPCTVLAGDVLVTLGGGARPGVAPLAYPLDVLEVRLDEGPVVLAVAHTIARRRFWRGECAVAMNAAWCNDWYLGPRSHPNDGLVDVTIGALSAQQRYLARRRVRSGSHLPHPNLKVTRTTHWDHNFRSPVGVWIDGYRHGSARHVEIHVRPDAGLVVV